MCQATLTVLGCQASLTSVKNDVRDRRTARDLSQGALAKAMGVSRQTINAIETGKYSPSLELAFRIARLFKVRVEDVFQA